MTIKRGENSPEVILQLPEEENYQGYKGAIFIVSNLGSELLLQKTMEYQDGYFTGSFSYQEMNTLEDGEYLLGSIVQNEISGSGDIDYQVIELITITDINQIFQGENQWIKQVRK